MVQGMADLAGAAIAWRQAKPMFDAAARPEVLAPPSPQTQAPVVGEPAVLEAHDLVFRHPRRDRAVLDGISLTLRAGDRVLLEGPSGGGKSTLASILTGLRAPDSGMVLMDGADRPTLGDAGWRRRVVAAPQFHENFLTASTLAFNLLMGRDWPAREADSREADEICRELGLGPLLERMPARLWQTVGETGWQLSHGERSRVYIARALLQRAQVVILDESFAALDPETLRQAMACVLRRAPALLVIAHP
jgi:ATP-binding cassette subfamily B protein